MTTLVLDNMEGAGDDNEHVAAAGGEEERASELLVHGRTGRAEPMRGIGLTGKLHCIANGKQTYGLIVGAFTPQVVKIGERSDEILKWGEIRYNLY